MYPAECEKMGAPVRRLNRSILDRLAAVDHHPFTDINPDMCCAWSIIGILEKYQISRSGFLW